MIYLTRNEVDVLNGIAYAEMSPVNGGKPETIDETGAWCWADSFSATLPTSSVKGVLGSLVKKALVSMTDYGSGETVVNFTELGFRAWQENDDNRKVAA